MVLSHGIPEQNVGWDGKLRREGNVFLQKFPFLCSQLQVSVAIIWTIYFHNCHFDFCEVLVFFFWVLYVNITQGGSEKLPKQ